jgi:hypothetical protein
VPDITLCTASTYEQDVHLVAAGVSCLKTGLAALGALMRLRQLFLEADMGDSRLRSLRLGANVMVTMHVIIKTLQLHPLLLQCL